MGKKATSKFAITHGVKINVDDEYILCVVGITYLYLSMIGCVIASVSNVLQI